MMYVFVFKQKTAYAVRISDWSSDVCSSDLFTGLKAIFTGGLNDDWVKAEHVRETAEPFRLSGADVGEYIQPIKDHGIGADEIALLRDTLIARFELNRSEERRGGKECVSKCRSRGWACP